MKFDDYNWSAIRKFYVKTGSTKLTKKRFHLSDHMFKKAKRLGRLKPYRGDLSLVPNPNVPLRWDEYNWVAIRKFFKGSKSKFQTKKYFDISDHIFNRGLSEGKIKLPPEWNCIKFNNAGRHPGKGVACDIREFLVSNESQTMTYKQIAKRFKCSGVNIVYHANILKMDHRTHHSPEHYERDWKEVQRFLDESKNLTKTARQFGLSIGTIYNRMAKGILIRPDGIGDPSNRPKHYKKKKA